MPSTDTYGLDFQLWAGDFSHLAPLTQLEEAHLTPRLNALGVGSITVRASDPVNAYLQRQDARFTCQYGGAHLMSGKVLALSGAFETNGTLTYTLEDDWRWMANTLAWVVPSAKSYPSGTSSSGQLSPTSLTDDAQAVSTVAHTAGTAAGAGGYVFAASTTYAETAIKEVVAANMVTRLGRPLTVLPDFQRGGDAYTAGMLPVLRFDNLEEGLAALLKWSKLRCRFYQVPGATKVTMETDVPSTYVDVLTPESGIIQPDSTYSSALPDATRVVVGGPGSDIARDYLGAISAATEAAMADIVEVFRDASGAAQVWAPNQPTVPQVPKYYRLQGTNAAGDVAAYVAAMARAGTEALDEGAGRAGLSLKLAETATFHFGGTTGVQLGDTVTARANGITLTGQVTEATLDLTADAGLVVTPQVGERTDDPDDELAKAISGLARSLRRQAKRK